jgi:hypothetical protein
MCIPRRFLFVLTVLLFLSSLQAEAKVLQWHYGVQRFSDSARILMDQQSAHLMDSFLAAHPMLASKNFVSGIANRHTFTDKTGDFYLLLFLCLTLGVIRLVDARYFGNLWKAFFNPTLSNRQLKDQLQSAGISNLVMNIFFAMSAGIYVYYVVKLLSPQHGEMLYGPLFISLLILGMMAIYAAKYAVVMFTGWAFKVETMTEHYLFNVFLINKILSIVLIPFVVIISFAAPDWAHLSVVLSFVVISLLFINRYIRSWQVFGSFFEYSKFHFFTYLCASELLPLAVLMKLLVRGLLSY